MAHCQCPLLGLLEMRNSRPDLHTTLACWVITHPHNTITSPILDESDLSWSRNMPVRNNNSRAATFSLTLACSLLKRLCMERTKARGGVDVLSEEGRAASISHLAPTVWNTLIDDVSSENSVWFSPGETASAR
ncbi:hypothetical protein SAY87_019574 [Trapa incisa]|uniref:Uncharacterized protein n=1 Tax=Trapa incisa TaxID=236973 RepID=A0AAN7K5Z2_9MYRT|nr:hypothetical protein SAY87_019574 [Trapa incisa]